MREKGERWEVGDREAINREKERWEREKGQEMGGEEREKGEKGAHCLTSFSQDPRSATTKA